MHPCPAVLTSHILEWSHFCHFLPHFWNQQSPTSPAVSDPKASSATPGRQSDLGLQSCQDMEALGQKERRREEGWGSRGHAKLLKLNTWPQKGLQQFLRGQGKPAPILDWICSL